jgi:hypothetical protein
LTVVKGGGDETEILSLLDRSDRLRRAWAGSLFPGEGLSPKDLLLVEELAVLDRSVRSGIMARRDVVARELDTLRRSRLANTSYQAPRPARALFLDHEL